MKAKIMNKDVMPKETSSLPPLGTGKEQTIEKEAIMAKKSQLINILDGWTPYNRGDWKKYNKKFAEILSFDNNAEDIKKLQSLVGIKNPDGKIGPETAYAISKYLDLNNKPGDFPRSTRKNLDELSDEVIMTNMEEMKGMPDYLYRSFVDVLNENASENTPNYVPDKELFMSRINEVIDNNLGNIDVHSLEGWETAFKNAGFSQEELDSLAIPRPEDRVSIDPKYGNEPDKAGEKLIAQRTDMPDESNEYS